MSLERDRKGPIVVAAGVLLLLGMAATARISLRFEYGSPLIDRPHIGVVLILAACGAVYLAGMFVLQRIPARRGLLVWVVVIGAALRAPMFVSTPIQEDDFYRYLWDGGVTAHGFNPYAIVPANLRDDRADGSQDSRLRLLATDAGRVFNRINHPDIATVYPPVAQGAFALAHWIEPWSLSAWRAVLLGFDAAVLALLLLLLRRLGKPAHLAAVYWWNPIVVMEVFNAAHMDVVILPFALGALALALANRPVRAGGAMALAIGAKIWPLLIAPVLARTIEAPARRMVIACATTAGLLALIAAPMLATLGPGKWSGFVAYGERWEMNDALFMVFDTGAEIVLGFFGAEDRADTAARGAVALLVLFWALWLARKPVNHPQEVCDRIVLVVGALFMLSPTQFPWYYLWIVPFLALSPRPSMLVLTLMLPLYYLKFYYAARDSVLFFHNVVVWFEYAPVFAIAMWEAMAHWKPFTRPETIPDA